MAIAFFSTWTTYGTWLPGDPRGWYQSIKAAAALRRLMPYGGSRPCSS